MWPSSAFAPLRFVGDCLAVAPPESATERLRAEILSNVVNWPAVIDLANRHALAAVLWRALRDRGMLAPIPPVVRTFLAARRAAGAQHRRLVAYDHRGGEQGHR